MATSPTPIPDVAAADCWRVEDFYAQMDPNNIDHKIYEHALAYIFDVPPSMFGLVAQCANLDLLWVPTSYEEDDPELAFRVNYLQAPHLETEEREPMFTMFSFLFDLFDRHTWERYDLSKAQAAMKKQFQARVRAQYKTAAEYVESVYRRSWAAKPDLTNVGLVAAATGMPDAQPAVAPLSAPSPAPATGYEEAAVVPTEA